MAVDTYEGRDVATLDIPRVYLQTETDKDIIILMEGALYDLIMKVATKIYWTHAIISSKGKPLLYI